ncbi:MAG: pyridoxal phosphate-dependent aminotransferase family protein [Bacteroidia bacterium]|nr:pyridoxal phosphate-dependent aminotransferase family protein [Bacteroidia bacterium]MCX7764718.1 pyridoxal phosphate-dependent aminotransferase family protein [Bacteroidia bacterium]MDW8057376.1 pyridoxal phosphate-dependent aminotransferase family protein [Bacteroidia bacterium]
MDLFEKVRARMGEDLGKYAEIGHHYLAFPKLRGAIGPHMEFEGKPVLVWSLNDYLGLANDPVVRATDAEAAAQYGFAYPMGSRMLTGNTDEHEALERELAEFVGKPDAFLLNYGYQGFMSVIDALTDRHDVVIYDQLSHACLIDGVRLSPALRLSFRHNDIAHLEERLERAVAHVEKTGGGILVITEGVFGMRGDLGALDKITALKAKYPFRLLVDDAHGFGVMGERGRGVPEHFGVEKEVDIWLATFAKSMALIGAFVAGEAEVIQYLRYHLRSQIYAKSLPIALVIGARKRLELIRTQPERLAKLRRITQLLQEGLKKAGLDIGPTESPVTPVYLSGNEREAIALVKDLRENFGIFCSVVTYPVIERGKIILRLIPTAAHTEEDVQRTIEAFTTIAERLRTGYYLSEGVAI